MSEAEGTQREPPRSVKADSAPGVPPRARAREKAMSNEVEEVEEAEEEELVLADLPDDELVKQMHDDMYDGLGEEIEEG